MATGAPQAIAIARPIRLMLRARPFSGHVAGRFEHACNLLDDEGRVIALTLPEVGNGPFSIVLDGDAGLFAQLQPGQPAGVDAGQIVLGATRIPLAAARVWDPRLPGGPRLGRLPPAIAAILLPYADWPRPALDTPLAIHTARLLAQGAGALLDAIERTGAGAEAAGQLAGLGHGLTPAGDDYLLGVMAGLWLLGERDGLPAIARAAAARTTALSGAFLAAAGRGQFAEPWHALARALARQDEERCREAVRRIAEFGATSGRDALAGFTAIVARRIKVRGE